MSNKLSSSKESKKKLADASNNILDQRKKQIDIFEKSIISKIQNKELDELSEIKSVLSISDNAKTQLDRGGSQFTKSDLITIILALDNSKFSQFNDFKKLRIVDLITIIRAIIYDPTKYSYSVNEDLSINYTTITEKKPVKPPKSKKLEITNIEKEENSFILSRLK